MWEYNYTRYPDELYHYGIMGMKWGVRRNAALAYSKALKKQKRLSDNLNDAKAKYDVSVKKASSGKSAKFIKNSTKATKYQLKANKKSSGKFENEQKAAEYQKKADKYSKKADKYQLRYEKSQSNEVKTKSNYAKAMIKSQKWDKAMAKTFRGMDTSSFDTTDNKRKKK